MNHNSDGEATDAAPAATPDLPFHLTGSQRKTAYALEKNVATLISEAGLECCGFLTLTVGDEGADGFEQVWDSKESSKRIDSLRRGLLAELFPRAVVVTERHKSGAIHFHLIVETCEDIRTGFDFDSFLAARNARKAGWIDREAEERYQASASEPLRRLWSILRERLPSYGFGRAELTPIYKTGEAVSRYVSKYVEKNLFNRLAEDKGKKLVRYHGFKGRHLKPNDFAWATPRAAAWRGKAAMLAGMVGATHATVSAAFGPRWSFRMTRLMHAFNESANRDRSQDLRPLEFATYPVRACARQIIAREASSRWLTIQAQRSRVLPIEWHGPQAKKRPFGSDRELFSEAA